MTWSSAPPAVEDRWNPDPLDALRELLELLEPLEPLEPGLETALPLPRVALGVWKATVRAAFRVLEAR